MEDGVGRTQIFNGWRGDSPACEPFTHNDAGTSMAQNSLVSTRKARSGDVPNIMGMTRPLAEQGILLHRSREYLKNHIGSFSVIKHGCHIYDCIALRTFADPDCDELACPVVSPDARDGRYGEMLPEHLFQKARTHRIRKLFTPSTHADEWPAECGFQAALASGSSEERHRDYMGSGRNSRVLVYDLV